jgi:hypothetical protein
MPRHKPFEPDPVSTGVGMEKYKTNSITSVTGFLQTSHKTKG